MKRKRVEAPRIPTLKDVHPHTMWSLCLRIYHKFHVERIGAGRKRVNLVLLDVEGIKMAATIYDDQVERLDPTLKEGKIFEIPHMSELSLPFFPAFIPYDQVYQYTLDNNIYVDAIGMVLYVSSVSFVDDICNRRIPIRIVLLMDSNFNIMKLVVKDKLVSGNLTTWTRSLDERSIVVVTMLRAKREVDHSLHTTIFSRVHFDPNIAAACQMRQRINNELNE